MNPLARLFERIADRILGTTVPRHLVVDDPELDAAVGRHPAGKGLRPGDPPPAA